MEHVEQQGLSIVLIGSFTPAIINPNWLASVEVISNDELGESNVDVVHPEITQFQVGDLSFEVSQDRFALHCLAEPFVRGADIIAGIFGTELKHTPITAAGLNYLAHFKVRDWHQQSALGRALAPLEPWGDWGKKLDQDALVDNGGLISITMQQSKLSDRRAGNVRATVQPSNKILPHGTGVFIQINDHYDLDAEKGDMMAAELVTAMITPSMDRSRRMISSMINFARSL